MSEYSHRGARPNVLGSAPPDRRIGEIDDALRALEASGPPLLRFARDPLRANTAYQTLQRDHIFTRGIVIHAIPHLNWYKVQLGHGEGWIGCMALTHGSLVPPGPRPTGPYAPNDSVLVLKINGLNVGMIIGVMPPNLIDARFSCGDWLVQAAGTGFKREAAHTFPITGAYNGGGVVDWSANRPLDEIVFSKGFISPNGPLMTITDWLVQVRVNEMCGLFLSMWDSWCRLAGVQLDIESAAHEERYGDDEGETRFFRGVSAYPWEALGLFAPGTDFTGVIDDKDVQYSANRAKVDLPEGAEDTQPFYRSFEYGGYLGQGFLRGVAAPPSSHGSVQRFRDANGGEGLFRESIGLDGGYCLTSAKRIHIGKRCKIVVPKEVRLPADPQGDDSRAENYKASGLFGDGLEHVITDVDVAAGYRHLTLAAGVNDLAAYLVNWQGLHPFHYHGGDFSVPQESASGGAFVRVQDVLRFDALAAQPFVPPPEAKPLHIDHRYGSVKYFEREAFLTFHDDGTVQIGAGAGEHIVLGGGDISFEAPGKIKLLAGTDLVSLAGQTCLRSHGSMDLSAANGDLRLKAEGNLHALAGNSGRGGILLESRGEGTLQQFGNRFGTDVRSSGIVLQAKNSLVAALSKDIYLRTGGELGEGDIVLDASRGKRNCYIYARDFNTFSTNGVQFNFGPVDDDSTVQQVYLFGRQAAVMDVPLLLGGQLIGYRNAGILLDGAIYATQTIATADQLADGRGGFIGQVPDNFADLIRRTTTSAADDADNLPPQAAIKHANSIVEPYYGDARIGSDKVLKAMGFSFRDPPGAPGSQYAATTLVWPEARWQMLARLGMAVGGAPWKEPAVSYQGAQTMPWPGRAHWEEKSVFLRNQRLTMFDAATGQDADRPYLNTTLDELQAVTMESGFTTLR